LVVNIDINSLLAQAQSQTRLLPTCLSPRSQSCADSGYSSTSSDTSDISKPNTTSKRSFLDLPAEIRNQIYRLALVSEEKLDFAYPSNFSRSSSLLQTCRQVHEEGRTILYSENTFYFQRRKKERAVRWTTDVYEIGYKDIRFFLRSIGLANVSLLRRLIVMFEDAQPSMNTHLKDADERRFTNDDDLMDTLRVLGDHAMLKTLDLCFQGRRMFYNKDESRFIETLTRIKADQVKCINNPETPFSNWKGLSKIASADAGRLVHEMTRQVTIFR
jgi:thermostable 8-oxoguanine DNA glycosylase